MPVSTFVNLWEYLLCVFLAFGCVPVHRAGMSFVHLYRFQDGENVDMKVDMKEVNLGMWLTKWRFSGEKCRYLSEAANRRHWVIMFLLTASRPPNHWDSLTTQPVYIWKHLFSAPHWRRIYVFFLSFIYFSCYVYIALWLVCGWCGWCVCGWCGRWNWIKLHTVFHTIQYAIPLSFTHQLFKSEAKVWFYFFLPLIEDKLWRYSVCNRF